MKIQLHIERLVLDGVPAGAKGARGLQSALESELSRLLAEGGLGDALRSGASIPRLQADSIRISSGQSATDLGIAIARSVFSGVNPEKS